jgi:hypothetical protein
VRVTFSWADEGKQTIAYAQSTLKGKDYQVRI